ncbi:hypothetical protein OSB04_001015 [Centaurea solstitialis]|uniref:Uncharacterized protein n=1 Tax=Centaurea solstitialis TaxID=347529 RepID=A0AA38TQI0_9ASTR|nr:hypothetical protein OSB04_001015 [Centaurea solstitialis]
MSSNNHRYSSGRRYDTQPRGNVRRYEKPTEIETRRYEEPMERKYEERRYQDRRYDDQERRYDDKDTRYDEPRIFDRHQEPSVTPQLETRTRDPNGVLRHLFLTKFLKHNV